MFQQMMVPASDQGNPTSLTSGCHTERSEVTANSSSLGAQKHTHTHRHISILMKCLVIACRWPTGPSASALPSSTEDTLTQETSSSASSHRTDPRYVERLVLLQLTWTVLFLDQPLIVFFSGRLTLIGLAAVFDLWT